MRYIPSPIYSKATIPLKVLRSATTPSPISVTLMREAS